MFVPAFAFAWWLASLQPTKVAVAHAPTASDDADTREDGSPLSNPNPAQPLPGAGEWDGERVKPKIVTPSIVRAAQGFLDLPMGDERFVAMDDKRYVFVLEWHYHPPGFVGAPSGWHKGVTVYEIR